MLPILKKKEPLLFDKKVLRKNDISLIIVDERWNALFKQCNKTKKILKLEQKLKDLLKQQARLMTEKQEISLPKKEHMEKILQLADENYQKEHPTASEEMYQSQQKIIEINRRLEQIEEEILSIPDKIKEANLALLEVTANEIYLQFKKAKKRIDELESEIEVQKEKLKHMISEKEGLNELVENVYSYFHDLLGREELEKLDERFMP